METMDNSLQPKRVSLLETLRSLENQEVRRERPFYWFLLAVMAALYFWALSVDPTLHAPGPLALLTFLMLLHAALHWIAPYLAQRRRWVIPYLVAQAVLLTCLGLASRNQLVMVGLYMGTMGESMGMLERRRPAALGVVAYLALMVASTVAIWGQDSLRALLTFVVPASLFVVLYVYMYQREAGARERAQGLLRELEEAHAQLAEYADRVEALTLAAERQRVARELHDTLSQGLAGLILQLEALEAQLGRGDDGKVAIIAGQAKERARATLAEARRTIDDLRRRPEPPGSLEEALRREVERFSSATGIPCAVKLPLALPVADRVADAVYRCVSEGLSNVARHARASRAEVFAAVEDGKLLVAVRDDGVGFDPVAAADQAGHYGLLGMRERARLAGGTMDVESAPGAGTTLRLRLPIQAEGLRTEG